VVLDADEVTDANVLRSRYLPCDVGSYKASTIVQRVNAAAPYQSFLQAYRQKLAGATPARPG
jgi:hypothetical protein